jgi:uncharacterized membrane protein YphA (DoxX/SURF4 family)
MSLLRFAARTMLASVFIVNGLKAFRDPGPLTAANEPLANVVLPLAEKALPRQVAAYLPEDAAGFVRLTGLAQVIGGLSLATGIGRRIGAGVLAATMVPGLLAKKDAPSDLLADLALTGSVLLASADTEGRPNLAWRARTQKATLERETRKVAQKAKRASGRAVRNIESALH